MPGEMGSIKLFRFYLNIKEIYKSTKIDLFLCDESLLYYFD